MRFLSLVFPGRSVRANRPFRHFGAAVVARFGDGLKCRLVIEARPKGYFKDRPRATRLEPKETRRGPHDGCIEDSKR